MFRPGSLRQHDAPTALTSTASKHGAEASRRLRTWWPPISPNRATTLKVSTLTRCLAAISIAHGARGLLNPAVSPLVRATMRGIRRAPERLNIRPSPSSVRTSFVVLGAMGDRLKDLRDRALLLIGFAGDPADAACRSPPSTGSWPARRGRKGSGSWDRLRRDPNNGFGEGRAPSGSGVWGAERCDMMTVAGPVGWHAECSSTFPDGAWRGGAGPGTGGVFVITYNGERIWDRKADGGFPDAKTLKRRAADPSGPRCRSHRPRGRWDDCRVSVGRTAVQRGAARGVGEWLQRADIPPQFCRRGFDASAQTALCEAARYHCHGALGLRRSRWPGSQRG